MLYNLARPAVYEAAIVGGQAFLLLGMVFALDAVVAATLRPGRLLAAGAAWAAALRLPDERWTDRRAAGGGDVAGGRSPGNPIAAPRCLPASGWARRWRSALGLFLLYNRLRFDGWFDFGQSTS